MNKIKTIIFFTLLLLTIQSFSQSFSYQGVLRNTAGEVLDNQSVGVEFKILQGSASGSNVYQETHSVTTDAYGIVSLSVGKGTVVSGNFSAINWSTQDHWLEVAADITGGTFYEVLGSTQLQGVPYASYAATSGDKAFSTTSNVTSNTNGNTATDDFVFGSSQLDNDPNTTDDDARMFFDKSKGAFRVGTTRDDPEETGDERWDDANVGVRSIAIGTDNLASGQGAVTIGNESMATADDAISIGGIADGLVSVAVGSRATTKANFSTALGMGSLSTSFGQVSLGINNTDLGGSVNSFVATDPLLVIGNGSSFLNTKNALVMLKNGNTTLNGQLTLDADNTGAGRGYTLPSQDGSANQVLSTDGAGTVNWVNATSTDDLGNHIATQALVLSGNDIYFRGNGDVNHGLGWFGTGKLFSAKNIDGPVLYGFQGGGLGTTFNDEQRLAIEWKSDRSVTISNAYTLPNTAGTANQIMSTDGSGNVSWKTPETVNVIADADGNTKIQVEETANDNIIRFESNGTEIAQMSKNANGDLIFNTITSNVIIGQETGSSNTGDSNVFIGRAAARLNSTGRRNVSIGNQSGFSLTEGTNNVYVGAIAGRDNSTGSRNTFIGDGAGATTGGNSNTMIGTATGGTSSGSSNVVIGDSAAGAAALVTGNTIVGTAAGVNAAGSSNVFLGNWAGANEIGSNKLFIENSATALPLIYGEFDTDKVIINGTLTSTGVLSANSGIYLPGAFGPDATYVGTSGNSISFGHSGASEDFIGYANNNFYFRDSPGGGDTAQPSVYAQSFPTYSSRRWKHNINDIKDALVIVSQLRGVTYTWNETHGGFDDFGFIAEEVNKVLPQAAKKGEDGEVDGVDYGRITPYLVEATKQQQKIIEQQQKQLQEQEEKLQSIEQTLRLVQQQLAEKNDK